MSSTGSCPSPERGGLPGDRGPCEDFLVKAIKELSGEVQKLIKRREVRAPESTACRRARGCFMTSGVTLKCRSGRPSEGAAPHQDRELCERHRGERRLRPGRATRDQAVHRAGASRVRRKRESGWREASFPSRSSWRTSMYVPGAGTPTSWGRGLDRLPRRPGELP